MSSGWRLLESGRTMVPEVLEKRCALHTVTNSSV